MTKFDFKKWVTEHKHGKKPLFEQGRKRVDPFDINQIEDPFDKIMGDPQDILANPLDIDNLMVVPPSSCADEYGVNATNCYAWSKCDNGVDNGINEVIKNGSGVANPGAFWVMMGSPTIPGTTVKDSDGTYWIYQGNTDVNLSMTTITPGVTWVSDLIGGCQKGFECDGVNGTCSQICFPGDGTNGCYLDGTDCNNNCNISIVYGCMDQNASNYNSLATVDDGSCEYEGCMDPNASNYDPTATIDDGSCEFDGCMDPNANNYDPIATNDDGTCQYDTTYDCCTYATCPGTFRERFGPGSDWAIGNPGQPTPSVDPNYRFCHPRTDGSGQYSSMGGKNGCRWGCKYNEPITSKDIKGDFLQNKKRG